jgi:hypothetical protein
MRLDRDTIEYFEKMAEETGMAYQNLMNLYLSDCARKHKKLRFNWK